MRDGFSFYSYSYCRRPDNFRKIPLKADFSALSAESAVYDVRNNKNSVKNKHV